MRALNRWQSSAILLVCPFICFWKIFLAHADYSFFYTNDAAQHSYPWYQYVGRWVHGGIIPLWDLALQSGRPLLGEMRPGVLYPFNLLLWVLTGTEKGVPLFSMDVFVVLAVVMASLFEYRLARYLGLGRYASIIAAIIYGYGGFIIENATWQQAILNSVIWLPLLVLLFLRAYNADAGKARTAFTISSGMVLGIMILAGHIQPPVHAILCLALLALYLPYSAPTRPLHINLRWSLLLFAGTVVLGGLTAAPQIVTSWEYGKQSLRWLGWDSLAPLNALAHIPYAWGGHFERGHIQDVYSSINPGLWAGADYFGVAPILLAIAAFLFVREKNARFFKITLVFGILFWLGDFSVLHGLMYGLIPLIDKVRQPYRVIFVIHFCLATLAGFGANALAHAIRSRDKKVFYGFFSILLWVGGIVAGVSLMAGMFAIIFKASTMTDDSLEWTLRFALLLLTATTLFYLRQAGRIRLGIFRGLLLILVAFDLFSFFSYSILSRYGYKNTNNLFPLVHYAPNDAIRFLVSKAQQDLFRVEVLDDALPLNSAMVHGYQEITGSTTTGLELYHEFRGINWNPQSIIPRLLNRRYIISRTTLTGFREIMRDPIKVYEDTEAMDRVAWIPRALILHDSAAVTNALNTASFDPRTSILVTSEYAGLIPPELRVDSLHTSDSLPSAGRARVLTYQPNKIIVAASATQRGIILLSEIFYPGWRAKVDGTPVPIIKADQVLRALVVPAGEHKIELLYRPTFFFPSLWLSLAVFVSFLISLYFMLKRA